MLKPKTCSVEGCERFHLARGFCGIHYRAHRKSTEPEYAARLLAHERRRLAPEIASVRNAKRRAGWQKRKDRYAEMTGMDYLERTALKQRCWRSGFTVAQYRACLQLQGGRCAVCRVVFGPDRRGVDGEHMDHCHADNTPRGVLCMTCNTVLGQYENHLRPRGMRWQAFEDYLAEPPVSKL